MMDNLDETRLMHDCTTKVQDYVRAWCKGQHQQGRGKVNLMIFPVEGRGLGTAVKSKAEIADYVRSYNLLAGDSNTSINKFSYTKKSVPPVVTGYQDSLALFFNTEPTESDTGEQVWNPILLILIHEQLSFIGAVSVDMAEDFFGTLFSASDE